MKLQEKLRRLADSIEEEKLQKEAMEEQEVAESEVQGHAWKVVGKNGKRPLDHAHEPPAKSHRGIVLARWLTQCSGTSFSTPS